MLPPVTGCGTHIPCPQPRCPYPPTIPVASSTLSSTRPLRITAIVEPLTVCRFWIMSMMQTLGLCGCLILSCAAAASAQTGNYVGEETCIGCHDTEGKAFHQTLHGKAQNPRSPEA